MKNTSRFNISNSCLFTLACVFLSTVGAATLTAAPDEASTSQPPGTKSQALKVHGIFRSNMVLQRDKPITIWGWAPAGTDVKVSLGDRAAAGKATGDEGRWEVTFDPQPANATRADAEGAGR